MRWTPHATVATIVERDGKFLMVEETGSNGLVWNQPAGHIEADESIIEAARRETLEETAWDVEITKLLGFYTWTAPSNGKTYHRHCFVGVAQQHHQSRPLDECILRAFWVSIDELRANQGKLRSPMVLKCIEDFLAGTTYPLELIQEVTA